MVARERLFFEPMRNIWRWERISDDDRILDYYELNPTGIYQRYSRDEIVASLRQAADALEACQG